jgi:hypothetical protein
VLSASKQFRVSLSTTTSTPPPPPPPSLSAPNTTPQSSSTTTKTTTPPPLLRYSDKFAGLGVEQPPRPPLKHTLIAGTLSLCGIGALSTLHYFGIHSELLNLNIADSVMLIGSFGATSALVYGAPALPVSQPRNVVGGHMVRAPRVVVFCALLKQSSKTVVHLFRTRQTTITNIRLSVISCLQIPLLRLPQLSAAVGVACYHAIALPFAAAWIAAPGKQEAK